MADYVATITFTRPERMNTISSAMLNELTSTLVRANEDRDVRVVVLTGTGRAFCVGLDLNEASSGTGIGGKDRAPAAYRSFPIALRMRSARQRLRSKANPSRLI